MFAPDTELWVAGTDAIEEQSKRRWLRCLGVVDDEELSVLFHSAAATVLPYNARYRASGASSGVLLQAVAAGCPLVIPRWLVDQVPVGYEAVFAYEEEGAELTAALGRALARGHTQRVLDQKAGAAAVDPDYTFEHYIDSVLALVDQGGT
jgi:glycosyltransferase involved in cell wall biosynthesis